MIAKGTLYIIDIYITMACPTPIIPVQENFRVNGLVMFYYSFYLWDKPCFETLLSVFLELAG